MSQGKLSKILELIINEDTESAAELLHDVLVEQSRTIYSELDEAEDIEAEVDEACDTKDEDAIEEKEESEKDCDAEELEEDFGGDEKEGFAADIAQDDEDIDSDENKGGEDGVAMDSEFDSESEGSDEDRIEDLEDQLADLRSEFDLLVSQEAEEPNHDLDGIGDQGEFGDEMGAEMGVEMGDEEYTDESMFEATKFQHEVNTVVDGEKDATNREAPYTNAPSKQDFGGKPVKIGKNGQGKEVDKTAAKNKHGKEDNVNVANKEQSADLSGEGKYSGTGKNSPKAAMQTKSPLTKKPK